MSNVANTIDVNNPDAIKEYLDNAITKWRTKREESKKGYLQALLRTEEIEFDKELLISSCYIDAFQSVRVSLFGELLPE